MINPRTNSHAAGCIDLGKHGDRVYSCVHEIIWSIFERVHVRVRVCVCVCLSTSTSFECLCVCVCVCVQVETNISFHRLSGGQSWLQC